MYNLFGNGRVEQKLICQAQKFIGNIIESRRKSFHSKRSIATKSSKTIVSAKRQQFAILDTLLMAEANANSIDLVDIQHEINTIIFETFTTTTTAITCILMMLAHHEDVQQRLFKEMSSTEANDTNHFNYLNAIIKETLRLYPPVPIIGRTLAEDTIIGIYSSQFLFFVRNTIDYFFSFVLIIVFLFKTTYSCQLKPLSSFGFMHFTDTQNTLTTQSNLILTDF